MSRKSSKATDTKALHKIYATTLNKEPITKTVKSTRKVTDLRDPCSATIDEEKAREMGINIRNTRESIESTKKRSLSAAQLIPLRENQTKETLCVRLNTQGAEEPENIYKNIMLINARLYEDRNNKVLPLEQMVMLGALTPQQKSLDDRQRSMAEQLNENSQLMQDQLKQLNHHGREVLSSQTVASNKEVIVKKRRINNESKTSVKINLLLDQTIRPFGYTRFASNDQKTFTFDLFDTDKDALRREFFQSDPLEDETPYYSLPIRFNMFRKLTEQFGEQYARRMDDIETTLVPKTPLKYFTKESIKQNYRRRPRNKEQVCVNGTRCLFYTYTNDPDIRYIGVVFADEICYDCFLAKMTLQVMDNISKECSQKSAINFFSVIVGEGEYSAAFMQPVIFNNIVTGIVGHVPRYDAKNRYVGEMTTRHLDGTTRTESYIAETGMDF
jgi:hypothetical protein